MAHIPSPSMTEWNGNNEWWQGSYEVQRSVACSSFSCDPKASAAPAGPFPASTAALPPPGHGGLAAPSTVASCMAVDGRSTPTSTRSGSSSPAPHQQAARGREGAQPCRQQGHHSSSPGAKPTAPWFEFLHLQASVKPLLRPRFPCSKKNQTTIDTQAGKERQAAEARAQRALQLAAMLPAHPYHTSLVLGPEGTVPQEHVVLHDKGKHRPEWCRSSEIFDPITSTSRPVTAPGRTEARAGQLSPVKSPLRKPSPLLCGSPDASPVTCVTGGATAAAAGDDLKASSDSGSPNESFFYAGSPYNTMGGELLVLQRRPGTARSAQGRYNPLTHTWLERPCPEALAALRITSPADSSSYYSTQAGGAADGSGAAVAAAAAGSVGGDAGGGRYDGMGRGSGSGRRSSSSVYGGRMKDTVADLLRQQSFQEASQHSGSGGGADDCSRPGTAGGGGGRKPVRSGQSWGTYDVLRHTWLEPPSDVRFINREMSPSGVKVDRLTATAGGGVSRAARAPATQRQGVYDPIQGVYKVPPTDAKAALTLDFAPRKLFQEKAFVRR